MMASFPKLNITADINWGSAVRVELDLSPTGRWKYSNRNKSQDDWMVWILVMNSVYSVPLQITIIVVLWP